MIVHLTYLLDRTLTTLTLRAAPPLTHLTENLNATTDGAVLMRHG
jgi:hypothetical protein